MIMYIMYVAVYKEVILEIVHAFANLENLQKCFSHGGRWVWEKFFFRLTLG